MAHTIRFKGGAYDQYVDQIRAAARAEGYATSAGFKEWAMEAFGATLRSGKYGDWTSISFKTEHDMATFMLGFKERA